MELSKYTYFDLNSAEKDLTQSLILPTINESSMIRDSRLLKDFKGADIWWISEESGYFSIR